jgi:hypothetical protein
MHEKLVAVESLALEGNKELPFLNGPRVYGDPGKDRGTGAS